MVARGVFCHLGFLRAMVVARWLWGFVVGANGILERLVNGWHKASEKADEMGVPHIDHFMGLSMPGLTNPINEDGSWVGEDRAMRDSDDVRAAK